MIVTYALELKLVLEDDDSAEQFRCDLKHSVESEWVKQDGESLRVVTKNINN